MVCTCSDNYFKKKYNPGLNLVGLFLRKILLVLRVILTIPFFTLYERKLLSYIQNRKGPKKVRIIGVLQPIFDGVKLILKESRFPIFSKVARLFFFSFFSFFIMVLLWRFFPFFNNLVVYRLIIIFYLVLTSLKVYSLIGSGWRSKSKYSLLGRIRGAAQRISYEVSLVFIVLCPSVCLLSYSLWDYYNSVLSSSFLLLIVFFMWLIVILAETKRAPFDFAEGERELVSGFKTEYRSLMFAFLFLGEYGRILWIRCFRILLFLKVRWSTLSLGVVIFSSGFIWIRGRFPRFRYDMLMSLAWKFILPVSLGFLSFIKLMV